MKYLLKVSLFVFVASIFLSNNVKAAGVPTNFDVLAVAKDQINMSWNAPQDKTNLAGYKVYRDGNLVKTLGVDSTSYQDTGLSPEKVYSYSVSSYDTTGKISSRTVELKDRTFHRKYSVHQQIFTPQKIAIPIGGMSDYTLYLENNWSNDSSKCEKNGTVYNFPGATEGWAYSKIRTYETSPSGCVYNYSWNLYNVWGMGNEIVRIYNPSSSTKFKDGDVVQAVGEISLYNLPNKNSLIIGKIQKDGVGYIHVKKATQYKSSDFGPVSIANINRDFIKSDSKFYYSTGPYDFDVVSYFVNGTTWWYVNFNGGGWVKEGDKVVLRNTSGWVKEDDIEKAKQKLYLSITGLDFSGKIPGLDSSIKIDGQSLPKENKISLSLEMGKHKLYIPKIDEYKLSQIRQCEPSGSASDCDVMGYGSSAMDKIENQDYYEFELSNYNYLHKIDIKFSKIYKPGDILQCINLDSNFASSNLLKCTIYSEPTESSKTVISLRPIKIGIKVTVSQDGNGQYSKNTINGDWYYVKYNNYSGWVLASHFVESHIETKVSFTVDKTHNLVLQYPYTNKINPINYNISTQDVDNIVLERTTNDSVKCPYVGSLLISQNENHGLGGWFINSGSSEGLRFGNSWSSNSKMNDSYSNGCEITIKAKATNGNNEDTALDSVKIYSFDSQSTPKYLPTAEIKANGGVDVKIDIGQKLVLEWKGKGASTYKISESSKDKTCKKLSGFSDSDSPQTVEETGSKTINGVSDIYAGCEYSIQFRATKGDNDYVAIGAVNIKVTGSYVDNEPPSKPTGIVFKNDPENQQKLSVSWKPSTDNKGVDHYILSAEGFYDTNTKVESIPVLFIYDNKPAKFIVSAYDSAGNHSESDPVTVEVRTGIGANGNTSYTLIVNNQSTTNTGTNTNSTVTTPDPTASITADGLHDKTYVVGNTPYTYAWSSTNADTYSSSFTSNDINQCGSSNSWLANTANGSYTRPTVPASLIGCIYTITYTVKNSKTGKSASDKTIVRIVAPTIKSTPTPVPVSTPISNPVIQPNTTIKDTTAPSRPTNLVVTESTNQLNLSWTVSTDNVAVNGYKVYRNNVFVANTTNNTFNDTGLTPDTAYTYVVLAYDISGNNSSLSLPLYARTKPLNQTTTTVIPNPTATFTIDGVHDKTFVTGNSSYRYSWSSANADTYSSVMTVNDPGLCGSSGGTWIANNASGSFVTPIISSDVAGCNYSITYTVKNSKTGRTASDVVTIRIVAPASSNTTSNTTNTNTNTTNTNTTNTTNTTNQTTTTTIPDPTASLTIDGLHDKTFVDNNSSVTYTYSWSSTNADTFSSGYTTNDPARCGSSNNWIAYNANGSYTASGNLHSVVGCTYTATYTAKNSKTGKSVSSTAITRIVAPTTTDTSGSGTDTNSGCIGSKCTQINYAPQSKSMFASAWQAVLSVFGLDSN